MKLLREPLVHFLVLGAGLFVLFGLVDDPAGTRTDQIVVTAGQIDQLAEGWKRTWQRPPTQKELDGLVQDYIREEVYYREALAMGLDRDDMIVRRRLRQKLEFLTDDLVAAVEPTEEQLQKHLAEYAEQFRVDSSLSFDHVYFNRDRRGDEAQRDAERLLSRLETASRDVDLAALGDPLLLPGEYQQASSSEIAGRFGREFAAQLVELPVGRWVGPVESGYGLHLVLIHERIPGQIPALEDVRRAVEREWSAARRKEAAEALYQGLRARYSVVVERR
jgi:hypothetical protein